MTTREFGQGGLAASLIIAAAMSAAAALTAPANPPAGVAGLCLPSPNTWLPGSLLSWGINLLLLLGLSFGLSFANKTHGFITGSGTLLAAFFALMTASNPWMDHGLNSSLILAAANLWCLSTAFSNFKNGNATQGVFLIATVLSAGSMIEYAFAFMVPVFIAICVLLKCLRFKEFLAMLMGLVAPYWVALGFGLVAPEDFHLPELSNLFEANGPGVGTLIVLINAAMTAFLGFILALNNMVKLYAGNSRRRLINLAFNLLGICCVILAVIDFNNITTYLATVYMVAAVQVANLFALHHIRKSHIWILLLMALYVALFLLAVI